MSIRIKYQRQGVNVPALATLLLAVVCLLAWPGPVQAQEANDTFVEGEVVVKLDRNSNTTIERINSEYGTRTKQALLENCSTCAKIYLLEITDGSGTEAKVAEMEGDPRLGYAEPNVIVEAPEGDPRWSAYGGSDPNLASDSTEYSNQYAIGALKLPQAHGMNRGRGSVVAVLDTGVQLDHPELSGSLTAARYDFADDDQTPADEPNGADDDGDGETDEQTGHGTHVAGIVHLAAPEARIMPLRVLDSDGIGNTFLVAEAVQYAVRNGADVVNLSLGSRQESELLEDLTEDLAREDDDDENERDDDDAVRGVPREGVAVVGAAGNTNSSGLRYPAAGEGAIAVASVNAQKVKSGFSNFGPWVDVAAPGEGIHSTFPESRYASWEGTSMATPFVAGQAALIRGVRPKMPAGDGPGTVGGVIKNTARPLSSSNIGGHADANASLRALNRALTVSSLSPKPGSKIKNRRPVIKAVVRDRETNLAKSNIRLFVDGRAKGKFSYNRSTDRLVYRSPRFSYKRHSVRIVATDAQGKKAIKVWRFRVVR